MAQRILIRGTNWIGDAVMTFPAISMVRRLYPDATIDLMARSWVMPVYSCHPDINSVMPAPSTSGISRPVAMAGAALLARGERYDLGILLPNSFESALIFRLAGIRLVLGYSTDMRRFLVNMPVPVPADKEQRHHVFYYINLVKKLEHKIGGRNNLQKEEPEPEIRISIPPKSKAWAGKFLENLASSHGKAETVIGFNPGAAFGPAKCWPAAKFNELASLLLANFPGMHILVFGTAAEKAIGETIAEAAPGHITNLCGRTGLSEAIALIDRLDLLVTNDSGLMHVGAACSTPLVAIFGSTNHIATGPWTDKAAIVSLGLDCSPCMSRTCPSNFHCMLGINAEQVFEASRKMLGQKPVHKTEAG